ncbi:hypothetical protein B4Q04_04905 [Zobellia sp. OII3]|uniref:heparin lyase I family protein n=1 Tax=Zobellia sp. OII3 TaxID=2034520 RepID=UPI000B52C5C1|nr:heparin lyase I family protein [Zobellia sp. OII3]OWW27020.1 hypothetical protein B4Q04_04905 [Zobellia sp. OII3]
MSKNWAYVFVVTVFVSFSLQYAIRKKGVRQSSELRGELTYSGSDDYTGMVKESDVKGPISIDSTEKTRCVTQGGRADESGCKIWCWADMSCSLSSVGSKKIFLGEHHLKIDTECNADQVSIHEGRLRFHIDPQEPISNDYCERPYNMRAEIRTAPWLVNHPIGTEEWFGWDYSFDEDYIIDKKNPWLFFQVHEGTWGKPPLIALWSMNQGGPGSSKGGEIHVVNNAYASKSFYYPTGFIPKAGDTLRIVVHVIWGDHTGGLLQVWINGIMVLNKKQRTVRAGNPVGGNAKWGIYKWNWTHTDKIEESKVQGVTSLSTSMGVLRIITRKPLDKDYLKPSYNEVMPD